MSTDYTCRICHKLNCDDDCEELAAIYREQQREKNKDLELDDEDGICPDTGILETTCQCYWCLTYPKD